VLERGVCRLVFGYAGPAPGVGLLLGTPATDDLDNRQRSRVRPEEGGKDQVRALWRATAETLLDRISDTPTWLSTAGLGVIWLHLRLDSRPKYYSHRPYAER
jgi:hypothetical protein